MATARLTERRIDALKPRKSAYDVRDRNLKGFGVRVLPSGARRYFIHSQHDSRRVWKLVGQTGAVSVDEARNRARAMLGRDPEWKRRRGRRNPVHLFRDRRRRSVPVAPPKTGNPPPSGSTGITTATISCPGSKDARSPPSLPTTSVAGSHPCTIPRCRRTGQPPFCQSSCGKRRSMATGRRGPIRARASSDIAARDGSDSCRPPRFADLARCWHDTKSAARRLQRS